MPDDGDKAQAGWYVDKRWPGEQRRWDGSKWLDDWRPKAKAAPGDLILVGLGLVAFGAVVTAVAFATNQTVGWIVLGCSSFIAGTVFNMGVIAKAVELGVRASRH